MMKNKIIVHCSATKPSMDIGAEEITRWHTDPPPRGNGWSGIGYNIVIRRDGTVEPGRDMDGDGDVYEEIGAHARGFNKHSIGICLVGGIDDDGKPDCNFTFKQYAALKAVIIDIESKLGEMEVVGHRDVDSKKPCPTFNVIEFLK